MTVLGLWKSLFGKKKKTRKSKKRVAKRAPKRLKRKTKKPYKPKKKKPYKSKPKPKLPPRQEEIGVVTHYFSKISVGAITLKDELRVGDRIHIRGAHDDFTQTVKSMQINHQDVPFAKKGDEIGIKVIRRVHENDKVYKA